MLGTNSTATFAPNNASQRREAVPISDDIEILKLLTALISLITAIVGLAKHAWNTRDEKTPPSIDDNVSSRLTALPELSNASLSSTN